MVLTWTGAGVYGGVIPYDPDRRADVAAPVEASQSAALFVGVRDFVDDDTLSEVEYGVDDAIDLAYVIAFERRPQLVEPKSVVLALSGDPQKPRSQRSLETLLAAGATKHPVNTRMKITTAGTGCSLRP
jgi:hypothetical protein